MELQQSLIIPVSGPIDGSIRIPGSKSLTNRALLIASLAKGESKLTGLLHSDDTHYMIQICKSLGIHCEVDDDTVFINGCNGYLAPCSEELYVGNAGTAARFLTAMLPLGKGTYLLNGNERMQQRPISDLITTLNSLGVEVKDINNTGCPPVQITGGGLNGGDLSIPGDKSSQYVSAIMMAAPYAAKDTKIHISGELVSRTYVEMTQRIMTDFGADCTWQGEQDLRISPQKYVGRNYEIEGDASSASYFFGMAAITGGKIKVKGLTKNSSQGDIGLLGILEKMGCQVSWNKDQVCIQGNDLSAVDVDMNTMSDVAPTLAVISLFAKGTSYIRNVGNMRIKECDRISAVVAELRKLGASVEEWEDGLSIQGNCKLQGAELETYDDHRMAMSFSLAGLKVPEVTILDPGCVSKTFPRFYDMFLPLIQG